MSGGTGDVHEMPCLGRPFQLGMLYDCRSDRLIPGVTLWDVEKLDKAVSRKPNVTSEFEIIPKDSFGEKTTRLEVGTGLKLSLLGELVHSSGAGKYLYDHRSSNNQARVSLRYKSTSRFEQLTIEHLGEFEYPAVFDEDIATHVVTGVLYGADAFFVFDRQVGEGETFHEVHGSMEAMLGKLPGVQVGGGASLDTWYDEKREEEKLKCSFHGDFILPQSPTTFYDAVKVYQELPVLLGGKDNKKSVPKKVWLYPLAKLDRRAQRIVHEISFGLVDEIQMLMENLHESEMRSNDLIKSEVCSHFPRIKGKLQKAKELIGGYKASLVKWLATLLPQIRSGGAEEAKLTEILKENSLSPFSHQHLSSWLSGKEKEARFLSGYLQQMQLQQQHIQLAFAPGEMDVLIQDLEVEKFLCFDFNVTGREDGQLQKMETYLCRKKVSQEDSSPKPWYETPALMRELRLRLRLYLHYVKANCSRQDVKYVVTDGGSEAAAESSQVALVSLYESACPTEFELADQPGKPTASDVTHDSLKLNWTKPKHGAENVQSYTISYHSSSDPPDRWCTVTTSDTQKYVLSKLVPKTVYRFKVSAETAAGASPESELSDAIETNPSPEVHLGEKLLSICKLISEDSNPPIYQLPTQDMMRKKDIAKVHVGQFRETTTSAVPVPHKVLMVVGATGAGKSTLINGIANYIMGVRWEDEFRFKLISNEGSLSQAHSQTSCITAYTFHHVEGSPLPYTLTVIDTPGFGDTRGLERDKEVADQIKEFFSIPGEEGIDQLHGIGFVTQAPLARLTPTQKYIFDSILAIFGKDIGSNIFLMITFADGQPPPVLEAAKEANVPFQNHFKFNNSALFANEPSKGRFNEMFWEMGTESFSDFFGQFGQTEAQSLVLTREVLREREHLETALQSLTPQINAGLAKIDELQQIEKALNQHEADIRSNKDFTFTVTVTKQKLVNLPEGEHVTNCLHCNYTCHPSCAYADDDDKYMCSAMGKHSGTRNAMCGVCPNECSWKMHKNTKYRIELYQEEEERTYEEIKARYDKATSGKTKEEAMFQQIKEELKQTDAAVQALIEQARNSLERLHDIALRPNPLTQVDYIDLLIDSEKRECKPGWKQRVDSLNEVRKKAEMLPLIKEKSYRPLKDFSKGSKQDEESSTSTWSTVKSTVKSAVKSTKTAVKSWWSGEGK